MVGPNTKEEALAGLLNGTMVCALGAIIPIALAWWLVIDWHVLVAGQHRMSSEEAAAGVAGLLTSFWILWFGGRLFWTNWVALRALKDRRT